MTDATPAPDDLLSRLEGLMEKATRRGLSIPGDPAWGMEQAKRESAEAALHDFQKWLPALISRLRTSEGGYRRGIEDAARVAERWAAACAFPEMAERDRAITTAIRSLKPADGGE